MITGLTGSIATGKSTVSKMFAELGAVIIDADKIVRQVQQPHEPAWREIVAVFGEGILLPTQELDRAKLGALVFADEEKRKLLNNIVHPLVRDERDKLTQAALQERPQAVVIWDIPLLIETGMHQQVDKTIVVFVDPDMQLTRLLGRDELTLEHAQNRINAQMPITEKKRYADFLIDNNGTLEETERQVREVYAELSRLAVTQAAKGPAE